MTQFTADQKFTCEKMMAGGFTHVGTTDSGFQVFSHPTWTSQVHVSPQGFKRFVNAGQATAVVVGGRGSKR